MLYAIGAGDQVLAVDDFSNFPAEAADKMQGLSGFEPNVESIAGLEPDLVLTDGTNADLLGQLDSLGIAHWEGPAAVTFDDVYTQIEQLGAATGHVAEAAELVGQMQADVDAVKAGLPRTRRRRSPTTTSSTARSSPSRARRSSAPSTPRSGSSTSPTRSATATRTRSSTPSSSSIRTPT